MEPTRSPASRFSQPLDDWPGLTALCVMFVVVGTSAIGETILHAAPAGPTVSAFGFVEAPASIHGVRCVPNLCLPTTLAAEELTTFQTLWPYLVWNAPVATVFMTFGWLWGRRMKQRLARRTRQLEQELAEHERTASALRESEAKFRLAVEATNEGLWDLNLETEHSYQSPRLARMFGYEPGEIKGDLEYWRSRVHPDDLPGVLEAVEAHWAHKSDYYVSEHRVRCKDGHWQWTMSRGKVVEWSDDGKPVRMVGTDTDITERKQAEESLRESEANLHAIFNSVSHSIILIDAEARIRAFNRLALQRHKAMFTKPLVKGESIYDFIPPEDLESFGVHFDDALMFTSSVVEKKYPLPNGPHEWYELCYEPVVDEHGETSGVCLTALPITERKRAEQALLGNLEFLGTLIDTIPIPVFYRDIEGVFRGCNPAFAERILGLPKDRVLGRSLQDLHEEIPPDLAEVQHEQDLNLLWAKGSQRYEARIRCGDGQERIFIFSKATYTDIAGQTAGIVGVMLDITDLKRTDEALRQSEQYNRMLFERSPLGLALCAMTGEFIDVNAAYANIIGRTVDETLDLSYWDVTPPHYAEKEKQQLDRLKTTGRYGPYEKEYIHKDGHLVPVRLSGMILDRDGEPYIWSAVEDITEQKAVEAQLRFQAELLDQIRDHITATDLDGRITYVNRINAEQFGASEAELIGQPVSVYGEDPNRGATQQEIIDKTLAEGQWRGEAVNYTHDGHGVILDVRTWITRDAEGNPTGLCGIGTDVTEKRHAEEALRRSEETFRLAMQATNDGLWDLNLKEETAYQSPRLAQMYGYDPTELEDNYDFWRNRVHPDDLPGVLEALYEHWTSKIPLYESEHRVQTKSGEYRWILARGQVVERDEQGKPIRMIGTDTDITERRRAAELLRTRTAELETITEHAPDLILRFDRELRIIYVNPAVCAITGLPHPAHLGKRNSELIADRRLYELWDRCILRTFETGEPQRVEYWIDTPQGPHWFQAIYAPVRNAEKEIETVICFARDMSELKRAEEALRQSEERYRSFVQHFPGIAFRADLYFNPSFIHGAVEKITGYRPEDFVATNPHWQQIVHPDDLDAMADELEQLRTVPGYQLDQEYRIVHRDGSVHWLQEMSTNFTDERGEPIGAEGTLFDITDRKEASEQLRRSEELLRNVIENIPIGIWVGDRDFHIQLWNTGQERMTGVGRDEVLGLDIFERFPSLTEAELDGAFRRVVETGEPLALADFAFHDPTLRTPDYFLNIKATALTNTRGEVTGIVVAVEDITDRKQTHEELARYREHLEQLVEQRTRELEESREQLQRSERLASIGTLAAGLAHEINNPVGGALLAAQNAMELSKQPDQKDLLQTCLEDIVDNAGRCRQITENVLQFARHERTERRPTDIHGPLDRAMLLTESYLREHACRLEIERAADLPHAFANPLGIEQVLVNLIRNAVEAATKGVTIRIRTEFDDKHVRVVVADNGRGMSAEQVKHLFDPFFTTRRERGGTGLGLSIVHGIISAHQGHIDVQSQPGGGTTFTITLPRAPESTDEDPHAEDPDRG